MLAIPFKCCIINTTAPHTNDIPFFSPVLSSGCYGFWCFPCFMCTTTGEFGESTCLPLLDICGPTLMTFFGVSSCVPPVTLGMRVAVRYKYNIGVSFSSPLPINERRPQINLSVCVETGHYLRGHHDILLLHVVFVVSDE